MLFLLLSLLLLERGEETIPMLSCNHSDRDERPSNNLCEEKLQSWAVKYAPCLDVIGGYPMASGDTEGNKLGRLPFYLAAVIFLHPP